MRAGTNSNFFASVLVLRLRTPPLYDITHVVEYKGRECPHALPLFGTKRFVEWLPRLGAFIQICRSLRQCFRASLQERDGVTIAHVFDGVLLDPLTHCFLDFRKTGLPIICPLTNSALYSRPVFFLLRCQLQRGLYQINPHVRQRIPVCCI